MSNAIESYNDKARAMNSRLSLLKKCGATYDQTIRRIDDMIEKFAIEKSKTLEFKNEFAKDRAKINDVVSKKEQTGTHLKGRIDAKNEQITKFQNAAKDSLNRITFKDLAKVKRQESVEELFKFFYVNLYHEKPETFDFNKFVNAACKEKKDTFQKKLAGFNLANLSMEERENLKKIKGMNFSLNEENPDLVVMLEWLDYNAEIYLLLKERDQLKAQMSTIPSTEKRYNHMLENNNKLMTDCDTNVEMLDGYIMQLRNLKAKFEGAREGFLNNPDHENLANSVTQILRNVEGFEKRADLQSVFKMIN